MVENVKTQIQSGVTLNIDASRKIKKNMYVKKMIFRILAHVLVKTCENSKYLGIITSNSVIICDKITEVKKTVPTKTVPTKTTKTKAVPKKFYTLLAFLLITVSLLTIVNIYFCFIKHRSKRGHLLPYHKTTKKLKGIDIKYTI